MITKKQIGTGGQQSINIVTVFIKRNIEGRHTIDALIRNTSKELNIALHTGHECRIGSRLNKPQLYERTDAISIAVEYVVVHAIVPQIDGANASRLVTQSYLRTFCLQTNPTQLRFFLVLGKQTLTNTTNIT